MAVAGIVPVIHDNMFRGFYMQDNVWPTKVYDVANAGFVRAGNTFQVPIDITRYDAAGDQAGGATLSTDPIATEDNASTRLRDQLASEDWQDPITIDTSHVQLVMNQERDSSVVIGYSAEEETLPSLIQSSVMNQAYVIRKAQNSHIRSVFDAQTGAYALTGPTIASWANKDTGLSGIYQMFREAAVRADSWKWPRTGRTVIVGPDMFDLCAEVVVDKNLYVQTDANGLAFLSGVAPPLRGWDVYLDHSIDLVDGGAGFDSAADSAKLNAYFCGPRMGVGFAQELLRARVFESEVKPGYLSRIMVIWGCAILNPRYQFLGKTTITAA